MFQQSLLKLSLLIALRQHTCRTENSNMPKTLENCVFVQTTTIDTIIVASTT